MFLYIISIYILLSLVNKYYRINFYRNFIYFSFYLQVSVFNKPLKNLNKPYIPKTPFYIYNHKERILYNEKSYR